MINLHATKILQRLFLSKKLSNSISAMGKTELTPYIMIIIEHLHTQHPSL